MTSNTNTKSKREREREDLLSEISDLGAFTFKDGDFRFGSSHLRSEISNPNIEEEKSRLRDLNEERSGLTLTEFVQI